MWNYNCNVIKYRNYPCRTIWANLKLTSVAFLRRIQQGQMWIKITFFSPTGKYSAEQKHIQQVILGHGSEFKHEWVIQAQTGYFLLLWILFSRHRQTAALLSTSARSAFPHLFDFCHQNGCCFFLPLASQMSPIIELMWPQSLNPNLKGKEPQLLTGGQTHDSWIEQMGHMVMANLIGRQTLLTMLRLSTF